MKYRIPARFMQAVISLLPASPVASAQEINDYTEQSLEGLMNIEVTSVSKKSQKVSATAAAIYVITQDEIRQSDALNIPDLLRMVPGVNVAQISSRNCSRATGPLRRSKREPSDSLRAK